MPSPRIRQHVGPLSAPDPAGRSEPSMNALPASWNIVLAGAWNPAIINPNWIGKHILKSGGAKYEVLIPVMGDQRVMRFTEEGVQIAVVENRLQLAPTSLTPSAMRATEHMATAILSLLSHTPVSACGINYGWDLPSLPDTVSWLARLDDSDALTDILTIEETQVSRTLLGVEILGSPDLNLKFTARADGGFQVDCNYDYSVESTKDGAARLSGAFLGLLEHAGKVLDQYGLSFEYPNEEEENSNDPTAEPEK